jgi:TonB family protein
MGLIRWLGGTSLSLLGGIAAPSAWAQSSEVLGPEFGTPSPMVQIYERVAPARSTMPGAAVAAKAVKPYKWFQTTDYPEQAIRERREGEQRVTVTVDAKGAIQDCVVTAKSGYALFDTLTCRLVRERGNFVPARDEAGEPTAGTVYLDVNFWLIPRAPSPPPQPKNP